MGRSVCYNHPVKRSTAFMVPILLLAGVAVLPLWKFILGTEMFFLSDAFYQHYSWQAIIGRLLAEAPGKLPLWNPAMFCGSPVLADPQFQSFYPPTLLYRFLPFAAAYGCYIAFHAALAVSGMAVFLSARGMNIRAVAIGSLGFGIGAHPSMLASMPPVLAAYSWLPWVALFAGKLAGNPGILGAIGLAVVLSWLGLAGSPQYGLYAVVMAVVVMAGESRGKNGQALRWGGIGALVALAMVAASWIPFVASLPETLRASAVSPGVQQAGSVAPWNIFSLLTPFSFQTSSKVPVIGLGSLWMTMHFIGVAALALAVAGAAWLWRERQVKTALGLVALGWAFGMGTWIPGAGPFFMAIPPFSHMRHAGLWMGIADFGIAWLAALGAMEAEKRVNGPAGKRLLEYLVLAIVFIGTIGGVSKVMLGWFTRRMGHYAGIMAENLGSLLHPAVVLCALSLLIWLVRRREIKPSHAFTAIGVITFLELAMVRTVFQPGVNPAWLLQPSETERAISADAKGAGFGRVFISPRLQENWLEEGQSYEEVFRNIRASFRSNLPGAAGFSDVEGNNPLRPAGLSNTLYQAQSARSPWVEPAKSILSDLGVRYLVARGRVPGEGWPVIHKGHVYVYRNPGMRGPAWISSGTGTVKVAGKQVAGEWRLDVDMAERGVVTISERASRGWRIVAPQDGIQLTTVRWGVLLGVAVPAGRHHISLRYDPPAVKIGLGTGFVVLAMLAGWGLLSIFQARKGGRAG